MGMIERVRTNLATVLVLLLSVFAHVWQLGRRPLAHDEAIDAFFSWQARGWGVVKYDPVYHGPLRFYLEGFILGHFGTTAGWTRAIAVLAGVAATFLIARSRRLLGNFGAPVAAVLFTISPTILTVTRTGREDSLTGLVSVALLLVVADALVELRPRHIVWSGSLVAVSFALKETTFILGFSGACFMAALAVVALRRPSGNGRRFFKAVQRVGTLPWMWSAIVFIAIMMVVFTAGFRYGAGFGSGLVDGIRYWATQHSVRRGSQHWFFYGTIYVAYEWLILSVAAVGFVVSARRRSIVGAWFATMAGVQFAVYSWAGEKYAWLALHPLIPAVLLAGLGAQAIADWCRVPSGRPRPICLGGAGVLGPKTSHNVGSSRVRALCRRVVGAIAIVLIVGTAVVAVRPAITDGADPRELLVTVQTSTDVPRLTARLAAARRTGKLGRILIDQRDGGSWPWGWYLHGVNDVGYQTIDPKQPLPSGYDAYIVSAATDAPAIPDGYTVERFALRRWWLPDYNHVTIGDLSRWLSTRKTWNRTASSDQYLIVRLAAGVSVAGVASG